MATVFLAEDQRLGRRVAVKRLHSDSPEDAAMRFEREAKVGASLSHPNLVTVFDTVADDEGVLIVMEYVEGENLAEMMARERVPAEQAVRIVAAVAGALDHAHQAGVIHRDVKPANILVSPDGKAKLVDLGIASVTERTQITAVGTVLGTPSYMAPEQLEGAKLTKAVDVYALGTVAFELLAGRKAVQGRTPVEIAHQIATQPAPDLLETSNDAPPQAARALQRAMSRDPAQRHATAGELARDLDRAFAAPPAASAAQPPTEATRAMSPPPPPRVPARNSASGPPRRTPPQRVHRGAPRWLPLLAALLALLVAAGAVAALVGGDGDQGTAPVVPTEETPAKPKKAKKQQQPAQQTTEQAPAPQEPAASTGKNPAVGSRLHNQAFALANQGRYDEAIALERKAIPMLEGSGSMDYWYALYNLGHALRLAGRPDEAIPILEKRLQHPNQRGTVQAELEKAKQEAGQAAQGGGGDE